MVTRAEVVAEARAWLGTPWRHHGRQRGVACDCAGLVVETARALGLLGEATLAQIDAIAYGRHPDGTLMAHTRRFLAEIPRQAMRPADVAVLTFGAGPQHYALLADYPLGGLSVLHAMAPARRVAEHRLDDVWSARIVAAFALPGVED